MPAVGLGRQGNARALPWGTVLGVSFIGLEEPWQDTPTVQLPGLQQEGQQAGLQQELKPSRPVWGHLAWRNQPWGTLAPEVSQPLFVCACTQPGVPCPPAARPGSRLCSASELPSWGARHTTHVTCLAFEGQGTWETKDRKAGHWDGTRTPPCLQPQTLAWPPICLASVMMHPASLQMVCNCPRRQGLLWSVG